MHLISGMATGVYLTKPTYPSSLYIYTQTSKVWCSCFMSCVSLCSWIGVPVEFVTCGHVMSVWFFAVYPTRSPLLLLTLTRAFGANVSWGVLSHVPKFAHRHPKCLVSLFTHYRDWPRLALLMLFRTLYWRDVQTVKFFETSFTVRFLRQQLGVFSPRFGFLSSLTRVVHN